LRQRQEQEAEPGPYDEVLHRLGLRHEKDHLATLGAFADMSAPSLQEQVEKTAVAVAKKVPILYQPAFSADHVLGGTEVEIVGIPDFLIFDGGGYIIRDSKVSRRIDEKNHPEILLQVQLYGWLLEKSSGAAPKALQIHSGTGDIGEVAYDGGKSALQELGRLLTVKQLTAERYEPVGWSKCAGCGFHDRCWKKAEDSKDVSLVIGIDQGLARKLHEIGTETIEKFLKKYDAASLNQLKRPYGKTERRVGAAAESILQCAEALHEKKEIVLATPAIPASPNFVMFDLEGMPPHLDELDRIYLWGAQVFGENPSEFMPAVSGFGPDGDRDGWLGFLANAKRIFENYGDIKFVHWATYESTYLGRYIDRYGDADGIATRVKANLLNLLPVTQAAIVLPLPSYSLKVIEHYVDYKRKQDEYGGQWAMATFIEATETSDEKKRKELMDKIIAYNREDLEATWAVFQWLKSKVPAPKKSSQFP
jgi:predicted RecB family nuclease